MRRAHLTIADMVAVHAVRAVYTAFAGVSGITRAEVVMGGATVEHDGTVSRAMLADAVALAGCTLVDLREERALPTL
jgi:copper chaperone CopZ